MAHNKNGNHDRKTGRRAAGMGPKSSSGLKASFGPEASTGQRGGPRRGDISRKKLRSRSQRAFPGGKTAPAVLPPAENLLPELSAKARRILDSFDSIVQGVRPLSSRQMLSLPEHIRELSHLLTDRRGGRRVGYLNDTASLSAYLRYFQWWNLVRLTRLLAGLRASQLSLPDEGVCVDIGSGPLTLPIALWLARPDLRKKKLTWYCIDYSQQALSLGEELYLAVVARVQGAAQGSVAEDGVEPWRIVRIKGELGVELRQKAHLVAAANVFNEVVDSSEKPPEFTAKRAADIISRYAAPAATVLVVEPGTPPAVRFLTAFRAALARKGLRIAAPCPAGMEWTGSQENTGGESSACPCPMDGSRGSKWCHLTFPAESAPTKLQRLSAAAGLPKERASLSFVLASKGGHSTQPADGDKSRLDIRIISEPISLPGNRVGHYGCCRLGLALVESAVGRKSGPDRRLAPGMLVRLPEPENPRIDRKSGAALLRIGQDFFGFS